MKMPLDLFGGFVLFFFFIVDFYSKTFRILTIGDILKY